MRHGINNYCSQAFGPTVHPHDELITLNSETLSQQWLVMVSPLQINKNNLKIYKLFLLFQ